MGEEGGGGPCVCCFQGGKPCHEVMEVVGCRELWDLFCQATVGPQIHRPSALPHLWRLKMTWPSPVDAHKKLSELVEALQQSVNFTLLAGLKIWPGHRHRRRGGRRRKRRRRSATVKDVNNSGTVWKAAMKGFRNVGICFQVKTEEHVQQCYPPSPLPLFFLDTSKDSATNMWEHGRERLLFESVIIDNVC